MTNVKIGLPLLAITLLLAACGGPSAPADEDHAEAAEASHQEGAITLSADQIATAGIELARPIIGDGGGAIELPATIEGDPQGMQVVSAAVGGRVAALNRNLGQPVRRGEIVAVIESREAASLNAEIEAARVRQKLAESNFAREQRLFAQRVSPEQDLIAARTAATEARIALRLAQQQASAAGGSGGAMNRIGIRAPISGQVISRSVTIGQTVAADAELYRVADLSVVSLGLNLSPADAGRVHPGAVVEVTAPGRQGTGRISFVSPALDAETRLVPAVARLDNKAAEWRVGETVSIAIRLSGGRNATVRVPSTAIQTVEGKTVVFVRTAEGFRATPVRLGSQDGATVVVLTGLTGRERIAAANSFTLKSVLGAAEAEHGGH